MEEMTLQEAFMSRNDLRKKIQRVTEEINSVVVSEKDQPLEFNPQSKLMELATLKYKLLHLNIRIDKANVVNIERLNKLRDIDAWIKVYTNIRNTLLSFKSTTRIGYSSDVIETQKNIELTEVTAKLEELETDRRKIDRELQKSNWETKI